MLLAAHLLLIGWWTLRPLEVSWVPPTNLTPFATLRADLALGAGELARALGGGLLLLAPVGALLPVALGRWDGPRLPLMAHTVWVGVLLAVAVQVVRALVPDRVVNVDTLMLNVVGVALAHLLLFPLVRGLCGAWCRARSRPGARRAGWAVRAGGPVGGSVAGLPAPGAASPSTGPAAPEVGLSP
ncbi:VanZ family protein [Streptomyces sp. NPDC005438]|uniref:VanZ family protein n=1 Tax=Streptomyces sp. NPDC005438 TaxID=3156880 RepID=UPI0033B2A50D